MGDGFEEFLAGRVSKRYHDAEGSKDLLSMFTDVSETDFDPAFLEIFSSQTNPTSWRIGESLAECYLEDFEHASIPYKSARDDKNPSANSHGADIVGLVDSDEAIFLFGEVKTSSDERSPPSVVYGNDGLISQLNALKSSHKKRKALIRWLGLKMICLDDDDHNKNLYKQAAYAYAKSKYKVRLVGILVRDTAQHENDLKIPCKKLTSGMHEEMQLKLLALYVPIQIFNFETAVGDGTFVN